MTDIKTFNRLNIALFITNINGGLRWTGLPFLAVIVSNNESFFSLLFFISAALSLFGALYGGTLVSKIGIFKIFITGYLLSFFLYVIIFNVYNFNNAIMVITILAISNAFIDDVTSPALTTWMQNLLNNIGGSYEKMLSTRQAVSITAKLVSFPLGPLVYSYFKEYMFLISGGFILIEFIIIISLKQNIPIVHKSNQKPQKLFSSAFIKSINSSLKKLITISFFAGILTFSITNAMLLLIVQASNKNSWYTSAFWLVGSASSLVSTMYVKVFVEKFNKMYQIIFSLGFRAVILIIIVVVVKHPSVTLLLYSIFVLASPMFAIINNANWYKEVNRASLDKGRINGIDQFTNEAGSLVGLLLVQIFILLNHTEYYLLLASALFILQAVLVKQYYINKGDYGNEPIKQ